MPSADPSVFVRWLRASGEPTRLRLLALCAENALSVSDLAQTLKQSEPRVSRHLKILCEAGLILRGRRGQWVHYRLTDEGTAASFVRGLLAQLDRGDPTLSADRSGARAAAAPERGGSESRLGRALAGLIAASAPARADETVLVVGVTHPELMEAAAGQRRCTALAPSRRAAQAARAFIERRGFLCRVVQAEDVATLLKHEAQRFDAVLLDEPARGAALPQQLEAARGALKPHGQLWVFERYEALESRGRVVEHPLARLRRVLSEAGLSCERLSPIEADGEHVLAALARWDDAPRRVSGARP